MSDPLLAELMKMVPQVEADMTAAEADLDQLVAELKEFRDSPQFPHPHIGVAMFQFNSLECLSRDGLLGVATSALLRLAGGVPRPARTEPCCEHHDEDAEDIQCCDDCPHEEDGNA
jgi:hypothetical protein